MKGTSLRASGMREIGLCFREMAGQLFACHNEAEAKCFRTAADIAFDRASYLLKEGRRALEDQKG